MEHSCFIEIQAVMVRINKYPFFVRYCPFLPVSFFSWKTLQFLVSIFTLSICARIRLSHIGQKISKNIFCKEIQPYFQISLSSFTHKFLELHFYQSAAVYLVRICTYKNADGKAHILFHGEAKTLKKTSKCGRKMFKSALYCSTKSFFIL